VCSRHSSCFAAHPHHPSPLPRAQFVELHREPLLEQLYDSFRRQYPEVVFREPPRRGSLRLEEVRRSTYFFS
jgi:DNA-directed RNA polymerase